MMGDTAMADRTDWAHLSHAYGPATDTPGHLDHLLSPNAGERERALDHLWGAVLHQGTTYPVTAPAAVRVSRLLTDTRTLVAVAHWTDMDRPPRLLRESLIDFLAAVAEAATNESSGSAVQQLALPRSEDIEKTVEKMWRGDYDYDKPDDTFAEAADVLVARAVLKSRSVLPEIAPRVLVHLTSTEPGVRKSATNAAAKFALALGNDEFKTKVLGALEAMAFEGEARDRASMALSIGQLGGKPNRLLDDPEFLVRSCAALAPALEHDPKATRLLLDAVAHPTEIDDLAEGLPQFEMRPRFAFVRAASERANSFEDLLPSALEIVRVASAYTIEHEIAPLLNRAFPEPYNSTHPLSEPQRVFLDALVSNDRMWDKVYGNPRPGFKKVGLVYDRHECEQVLKTAPRGL